VQEINRRDLLRALSCLGLTPQPTHGSKARHTLVDFNPSEPAILHERREDKIIPWTGELKDRWSANARIHSEGVTEFEDSPYDGWGHPLGG
jgi:hypothetical protein